MYLRFQERPRFPLTRPWFIFHRPYTGGVENYSKLFVVICRCCRLGLHFVKGLGVEKQLYLLILSQWQGVLYI